MVLNPIASTIANIPLLNPRANTAGNKNELLSMGGYLASALQGRLREAHNAQVQLRFHLPHRVCCTQAPVHDSCFCSLVGRLDGWLNQSYMCTLHPQLKLSDLAILQQQWQHVQAGLTYRGAFHAA